MTASSRASVQRLRVIRFGTFSGSGTSLVDALRTHSQVEDIDVTAYRRHPSVMRGRLLATIERKGTRKVSVSKTAAWSTHVQKALNSDGNLDKRCPTVFIQSIHAYEPPEGLRYVIYTDRVGREGQGTGGTYRSRFTAKWLRREERFLRGATAVFVMGPSTKIALTEMYGLDPGRVSVIGAGPNGPVCSHTRSTRLRRLVFVGVEWERKGGPELLEAFAASRQVMDDLELVIVGSRPDGHPPDGVTFAGRLTSEDVSGLYSESDALVIPTHMEAFGIAIVEALLHGLPCIGTTVGNQEWLIGDAGVLVPPGDVDALTEALIAVAEGYGRLRAAALQRKNVLEQVMNWQVVADKVLAGLLDDTVAPDIALP